MNEIEEFEHFVTNHRGTAYIRENSASAVHIQGGKGTDIVCG